MADDVLTPSTDEAASPSSGSATPTSSSAARMRTRLARIGRSSTTDPVLEPLFRVVRNTHPKADLGVIERAYRTAEQHHEGQKRKSGDPFITHPLAVTTILAAFAGLAVVFLLAVLARASSESRQVALATGIVVGGMGAAVILVFLFVDLPDIGDTGLYDAPGAGNLDATGTAAAGLWMELVGGLILLLSGAALATLRPEQLATVVPDRNRPAEPR